MIRMLPKFLTVLVIILVLVGSFMVFQARGSSILGLTLKTNPDLENGLTNHWTFDGTNMNYSQASAEVRDRVGSAHGDLFQSVALAANYVTSSSANGGSTFTPATPFSWAHNHSSGNFLAVGVSIVSTSVSVTGITYNSVALSLAHATSSLGYRSEIWYLINPASGSNTLEVTLSGTPTEVHASAVSLSNVSALDPIDLVTSGFNTDDVTTSFTPNVAGTVAIEVLASSDAGQVAPGADQVERFDVDMGSDVHAIATKVMSIAGATSTSWNAENGATNVVALAVFKGDQASAAQGTGGKIGQALAFNQGTSTNYIDMGNVGGTIKSVAFWIRADDATSEDIIDIDGTDQIETNASDQITATSFPGSITYYIDGVSGARVIQDKKWHHVVITDTTGVSPTNMDIGRQGTSYFGGVLDDVRFYNRVISQAEITRLYHLGATTREQVTLSSSPSNVQSLTGHWTLDGTAINWGAGTAEAIDVSGNGRHGDVTGTGFNNTAVVPGRIGQTLFFDGVDDQIDTNQALSAFISSTNSTMSAWIYATGTAPVVTASFDGQGIIGDINGFQGIFRASISGADRIWVENWDTNEDRVGITYNTNQWTHIALVHTGGTLYGYKNGELFGSTASGDTDNLTNEVRIGVSVWPTPDNFFSGAIDDVRTYSRAFTAAEVKRLYHLGATTQINRTLAANLSLESALTHHYTFDGPNMDWSQASEVRDRGTGGKHGDYALTKVNVLIGKLGQALDFSGTTSGVDIASPTLSTGAFTYAAWFYKSPHADETAARFYILETRVDASGGSDEVSLYINNSLNVVGIFDNSTTVTSNQTITNNRWTHVTLSRSSAGTIRLYINGTQDNTGTDADTLTIRCNLTLGYSIQNLPTAGGCSAGAAILDTYDFSGTLDDVRVYNRELSASEIVRLYQLGSQ